MRLPCSAATVFLLLCCDAAAQRILDIGQADTDTDGVLRVLGADGNGNFGVPVSGGYDVDGDGFADAAVAFMTADPMGRTDAGQVVLYLGNGTIAGELDSASPHPQLLTIIGAQVRETVGAELWIEEVTGDSLADLIILRQNHNAMGTRTGSGAVTIIPGASAVGTLARSDQTVDLAAPPGVLNVTTLLGATAGERLGIWLRTGDLDGDGISDLVIGADQRSTLGSTHHGMVYGILGGPHLASGATYDLAATNGTAIDGQILRVFPSSEAELHFGATVQAGDLDGNGRAEIVVAGTLNRAGASLRPEGGSAHGTGGVDGGRMVIVWDDNYPAPWSGNLTINLAMSPGAVTTINGGADSSDFGEELLAGLDYDGSGQADLFVGDLTARSAAGDGWILYDVAAARGLTFDVDTPPAGLMTSRIRGPIFSALGADTAAHGDFDLDGFADLAFCSPKDAPLGRTNAGSILVLMGQAGGWPADINVANPPATFRHTQIYGAKAQSAENGQGDILCYSGDAGDLNADGAPDLIVNEMTGDGSAALDVGNLLIIDGLRHTQYTFADGFEQ